MDIMSGMSSVHESGPTATTYGDWEGPELEEALMELGLDDALQTTTPDNVQAKDAHMQQLTYHIAISGIVKGLYEKRYTFQNDARYKSKFVEFETYVKAALYQFRNQAIAAVMDKKVPADDMDNMARAVAKEKELDQLERAWRIQISAMFGKASPDPTLNEVIADLYAGSMSEATCALRPELPTADLVRGRTCHAVDTVLDADQPLKYPLEGRPPAYISAPGSWYTASPPAVPSWEDLNDKVLGLVRYSLLADTRGVAHLLDTQVYSGLPRESDFWFGKEDGDAEADEADEAEYESLRLLLAEATGGGKSSVSGSGSGSGAGPTPPPTSTPGPPRDFEHARLVGMSFSRFFRLLYVIMVVLQPAPDVYDMWKRRMSLTYGKATAKPPLVEVAGDLYASLLANDECTDKDRADIELIRGRGVCRAVTVPDVEEHDHWREAADYRPDVYRTKFTVGKRIPTYVRKERFAVIPKGKGAESWAKVDAAILTQPPDMLGETRKVHYFEFDSALTAKTTSFGYVPLSSSGYDEYGRPRGKS